MLNFAPKGSGVSEVAALVGPMLGPYGMDHMVLGEGGEILLSKDGTTILQHLPLLQPYARLLLTLAKAQVTIASIPSINFNRARVWETEVSPQYC